jgi:hypothetical protein
MVRAPVNIFVTYGLVGLAIAGGVITVSHVTSTVVPVFPKYGQLSIDLVLSSSAQQAGSSASYAPVNDNAHQEDDTLNMTTDSVMVYHGGLLNPTATWTTLQDETTTVTLRTGVKVHLGSLALPEGNVTSVRLKIVGARIQRGSNGILEDLGIQGGQFEISTRARVTAQTTTSVLIDFHLACPTTVNGNSSGQSACSFTPSAENED